MKKLFLCMTLLALIACNRNTPDEVSSDFVDKDTTFVDLGLPSKTKWKTVNENGFFTFNEATTKFGKYLPTKDQWQELKNECTWEWTGKGYKVTGKQGKSIVLPAAGMFFVKESEAFEMRVGVAGYYWSSNAFDNLNGYTVKFSSGEFIMLGMGKDMGASVRLIK